MAAKNNNVKRIVFAASSSTYGDSKDLPKIEDSIGKPLSPYAVTKLVNEIYADVFYKTYGIEYIGLRYFNVFGEKQDPYGSYAAVIPIFIRDLINHTSPTINGDGSFSRDFTYIDNVIQANKKALFTNNKKSLNQIYNIACGKKTTLNELYSKISQLLSEYSNLVKNIKPKYGEERLGDVPHSLASIDKAREFLGYIPEFSVEDGLKKSINWYWNYFNDKDG